MLKIMSFIIKLDTRFLLSTHKLPPTFRRTHARAHKHTNGSGIPRLSAEFLNLGPVKEPWWFPEGRELGERLPLTERYIKLSLACLGVSPVLQMALLGTASW